MSERRNRTLLDMVRSLMSPTDLPFTFWGYSLEIVAFTLNRVPSKAVEKTPYEMCTCKRPSLSFLKIWGYEAYVKRQVSNKLEPKSDKCLFVGNPKETKGYYFYNPIENKVFVARNGVFLESEFISKGTSGSKVQFEEVREPQDNIELPVDSHSQKTIVDIPPMAQNLRRSNRIRHEPERYGFLVTDNHDVLLVDQNEPTTYLEAMLDPDFEKWLEAMKSEIQSMYDNQVWTLIDPP